MTHYETLGVPRDASQADIKRAYRAKSSAAHPDRNGGDTAKMSAINAAYDVLRDPQRRADYDAGGKGSERSTIEEDARKALVGFFRKALEAPEHLPIVQLVREIIKQGRDQNVKLRGVIDRRRRVLHTRRKMIRAKGENLIHMLIDGELQSMSDDLVKLDYDSLLADQVEKLIGDYESLDVPPSAQGPEAQYRSLYTQLMRGY